MRLRHSAAVLLTATALQTAVAADVWRACEPGDVRPQDQAWERAYQQRVERLVEARDAWRMDNPNRDADVGKWTWSPLLAEIWRVRDDKAAVQGWIEDRGAAFMRSRWAGTYHKPFSAPGHVMYCLTLRNQLPDDQLQHARGMIRKTGWQQMMRGDGQMDPIYSYTEFNSENFNWMARMTGLLWAEELNDQAKKAWFGDYLKNLTRALFNAGRVEWNSNNYWGHTFNPLMPLVTHVRDPKHRARAWAIADWMIVEAALHHLDGFQVAVDTRAKTGAYKPFAGSVWAYAYLYFVGDGYHPTYPADALREHADYNSEVGYFGYSAYRPPAVALPLARKDFPTPVEIRSAKPHYHLDNDNYAAWNGTAKGRRNEFETLYIGENFILTSLATLRPDGLAGLSNTGAGGAQKPFSEQSVWRLGVKGTDNGAVQVFGNAGPPGGWGHGWDTMAGRQPHEQIGQYGAVMIRLWQNLARGWVAVPLSAETRTGDDGRLFVDLGRGVYFAVVPVQPGARHSTEDMPGRKGAPGTHRRHVWTGPADSLGGLVLEVGTHAEHGSFDAFCKTLHARPTVDGDTVTWTAANGEVTRMQHTGTTTYTMVDDAVVDPAGKLPALWQDGEAVDYMRWPSYGVVRGPAIVDQPWGGGVLTVRAGDHALRITVAPETAQVSYAHTP